VSEFLVGSGFKYYRGASGGMQTIALAGAKGGCGKTTATLGIAEAIGRTGTTTLAVDADRQLPNLHVMGGCDRTPTVGDVPASGAGPAQERIETVAHRSPRVDTTGLITAAPPDAEVALEHALERLSMPGVPIFVDCPSGAGPDLLEPLSGADGVIVVTTASDRSLVAAETTVDIAGRLGVPVLGVVCTRCAEPPETIEQRLEVPLLGGVPEQEDPLTDEEAVAAFDDIAARIEPHVRAPIEDTGRLSTGFRTLDSTFGGGLPPGTTVLLEAPAASQIGHVIAGMTAPRGTLYLTTEGSERAVTRTLEATPLETGTPTVRSVPAVDGDSTVENAGKNVPSETVYATEAIERATTLLEKLPNGATFILDSLDALEDAPTATYRSFLRTVRTRIAETDGVAFLYGAPPVTPERSQAREVARRISDVVLAVEERPERNQELPVGWNADHSVTCSKCSFDPHVRGSHHLSTVVGETDIGDSSTPLEMIDSTTADPTPRT